MTFYTVRYAHAALVDLEEAINYYDQHGAGLGACFAEALLAKVEAIAQIPVHAGIRYAEIRCRKVDGFPYLIHYSFDEEAAEVIIEAVFYTYRQPLWDRPGNE